MSANLRKNLIINSEGYPINKYIIENFVTKPKSITASNTFGPYLCNC